MSRGKTLEQMDQVFHSHTAQADMQSKQEIYDLIMPTAASRSATLEAAGSNEKGTKASQTLIEHKV
jgi:hypothetical protein